MSPHGADYGQWIAGLLRMSDETWKRHASGWSVWTRFATLPILILAVASHAWFGWGIAAVLVALIVVWLFLNPRLFPPPRSTDSWAARATLGERVWLNRGAIPIPRHHEVMAHLLSGVALAGFVIAVYGAVAGDVWPAVLGVVVGCGAKAWFCDRMVWLYENMKDRSPLYRSWLR